MRTRLSAVRGAPVLALGLFSGLLLVLPACTSATPGTSTPTVPPTSPAASGPATVPPGPALTPPPRTRPLWGDLALFTSDPTSGIEALAHIEANDRASAAELTILAKLPPGTTYTAHLHSGTCESPSATVAQLGTLTATPDGRARLVVTQGPTLTRLTDTEHALDLHDATGTLVACGDIPTAGAR